MIGTVLGSNGRPQAGVCVTAHPVGSPATPGGPAVVTSRTGTFMLPGLAQGAYSLSYRRCTTPDGQISWPQSAFQPAALLTPLGSQAAASAAFVTGGKLTMLQPVTVGPRFAAATPPQARRPHAADPVMGAEISGTVTSPSGHPVTDICIGALTPKGVLVQQTQTAKNGSYELLGLKAGQYGVQFFPGCVQDTPYVQQWWPGTATETKKGLIRLRTNAHRGHIDAKLAVGGIISGTVRLGGPYGRPLGGICANASIGGFDFAGMGTTDSHGHYQIRGLPTGRYSVEFNPGCGSNGNYLDASIPHPVTVHLGQVTRSVDGVLQPGAEVSGTVTDQSNGKPLRGICVSIDNGNAMASTGPHGTFFAKQVPPGRFTVEFANCTNDGNFAPQFYPGQLNAAAAGRVTLTAGKVTTQIDAVMTPGGAITGTLRSQSGVKLTNVCAAAIPAADLQGGGPALLGLLAEFGVSDAGKYTIGNLAADRYQVAFGTCNGPNFADQYFKGQRDFARADQISIGAGQTVSGINATLAPAGVITGTVGGPANQLGSIEFVCVSAVNTRTGLEAIEQPFTNVGGSYALGGLATGSYTVDIEPCSGQNLLGVTDRSVPVTARHVTRSVNGTLRVGGTIKGRVVSAASGRPLANVCIGAFDSASQTSGFGTSNSRGDYVVVGLNSGRYRLFLGSCGTAHLLPAQTAAVTAVVGRAVPGPTVRMRAFVPGSVSGRVKGPAGGTPGPCVDVLAVRGASPDESPGFTAAGVHGYYEVGGLVPGRYQVFFGDPFCETDPGGLIPQWYNAKPSQKSATVITIKAGKVTRPISATLRPDGEISGTVTGPGGRKLTGICVRAISQGNQASSFLAVTGSTGSYQLGPLQPGRYQVEFLAGCGAAGYKTQWWKNASSAKAASSVLVKSGRARPGIDAALTR